MVPSHCPECPCSLLNCGERSISLRFHTSQSLFLPPSTTFRPDCPSHHRRPSSVRRSLALVVILHHSRLSDPTHIKNWSRFLLQKADISRQSRDSTTTEKKGVIRNPSQLTLLGVVQVSLYRYAIGIFVDLHRPWSRTLIWLLQHDSPSLIIMRAVSSCYCCSNEPLVVGEGKQCFVVV